MSTETPKFGEAAESLTDAVRVLVGVTFDHFFHCLGFFPSLCSTTALVLFHGQKTAGKAHRRDSSTIPGILNCWQRQTFSACLAGFPVE